MSKGKIIAIVVEVVASIAIAWINNRSKQPAPETARR